MHVKSEEDSPQMVVCDALKVIFINSFSICCFVFQSFWSVQTVHGTGAGIGRSGRHMCIQKPSDHLIHHLALNCILHHQPPIGISVSPSISFVPLCIVTGRLCTPVQGLAASLHHRSLRLPPAAAAAASQTFHLWSCTTPTPTRTQAEQ